MGRALMAPHGSSWAEPLLALPGPYGPGTYGPGPYGSPWTVVGRALMGWALICPPGPLWGAPLWAGPLWAMYIYMHMYIYGYIYIYIYMYVYIYICTQIKIYTNTTKTRIYIYTYSMPNMTKQIFEKSLLIMRLSWCERMVDSNSFAFCRVCSLSGLVQ